MTRIRSTTNYYEILSIERSASEDDIRRAYRKLALRLHPDKNCARGADDAFKSVSRAYACLSDAGRRAHYDTHGCEQGDAPQVSARQRGPPRGSASQYGYGPYGGGVYDDPSEIFNAFFGGNPFVSSQFSRARRARGHAQAQQAEGGFNFMVVLQALPVIVLVLFSLFSSSSRPVYSLERTREYSIARETAEHGVPFFVAKPDEPDRSYEPHSRGRHRLEAGIENEYREFLNNDCYQQRMLKQRYQYFGQQRRADGISLASCQTLERIFSKPKRVRDKEAREAANAAQAAS